MSVLLWLLYKKESIVTYYITEQKWTQLTIDQHGDTLLESGAFGESAFYEFNILWD
jgi:hypothetical protein